MIPSLEGWPGATLNAKPAGVGNQVQMKFRIYRNSAACFRLGGDLNQTDEHYTDAWFERLREHGFNGFWLNVWMRKLVAFRESENAEQIRNQDILKRLMDRAARFDVGVYLFLNEPKAFPRTHRIWDRFPGMRGAPGTWPAPNHRLELNLLCTSTPEGQAYVYESARRLHQQLPDLAGTVHINASESPTHCYCHSITNPGGKVFSSTQEHPGIDCPRCAERTPEEIIAEILNLYRRGCRDAGSRAPVIAWNWNWIMYAPHPQEALIRRLDPDIHVLADFECGGRMEILGQERPVAEYSLLYTGPSERYTLLTDCALRTGHRIGAKLQIGTTHELATVANLPLLGHLYDKLAYLRRSPCEGIFATWNFGNRFTLNSAAFALSFRKPTMPDKDEFLTELGRSYLGLADERRFAGAIAKMEAAFRHYPLCNEMIYFGPINFALGLPLDDTPLQGAPLTVSCLPRPRGDSWDNCLGPFTLDEVIGGYAAMVGEYRQAVRDWETCLFPSCSPWHELKDYHGPPVIRRAVDQLGDADNVAHLRNTLPAEIFRELPELEGIQGFRRLQEWCNGWAILACLESAWRLFQNYQAKRDRRPDYPDFLRSLQADECRTLAWALPVFRLDERMGWHLEPQAALITVEQLEEKYRRLQALAGAGQLRE